MQTDEKGENLIAYSVCRTPEGILFGGQGKIYHYSYKESCIRKIYEFKSEQNFNITALGLIDSHTILCCSRWQGMYLVDLQSGEYRRAPLGQKKKLRVCLLIPNKECGLLLIMSDCVVLPVMESRLHFIQPVIPLLVMISY